jgi:hypothetical protein
VPRWLQPIWHPGILGAYAGFLFHCYSGPHFQAEYLLQDRLTRVDFDLPDDSWSLDSVELCAEMIHRGRQEAAKMLVPLQRSFLDRSATPFVPYDAVGNGASALVHGCGPAV